jgi:hypothetical protein
LTIDDIAPERSYNAYKKRFEDEHAVIFGMTRFGKSYLVERLIRMREYVVIHDPKAEYDTKGFKVFEKLADLLNKTGGEGDVQKYPRIIYQPSGRELRDEEAQSTFFGWIYHRGNTFGVIDELNALCKTRTEMPDGMVDCYARGNAKGVALCGLTQEPVFVPSMAMTQARHRYAFFTALLAHQKKICGLMPGLTVDAIEALMKKQFYYYRQGEKNTTGPFFLTKAA